MSAYYKILQISKFGKRQIQSFKRLRSNHSRNYFRVLNFFPRIPDASVDHQMCYHACVQYFEFSLVHDTCRHTPASSPSTHNIHYQRIIYFLNVYYTCARYCQNFIFLSVYENKSTRESKNIFQLKLTENEGVCLKKIANLIKCSFNLLTAFAHLMNGILMFTSL